MVVKQLKRDRIATLNVYWNILNKNRMKNKIKQKNIGLVLRYKKELDKMYMYAVFNRINQNRL
jgi:hypothetical protein